MKIFVDNDVILDVLLERENFAHSQELLIKIEQKLIKAYTSPLIFTNSFYIVSKLKTKKKSWIALKKIRLLFNVAEVDERIVDMALASEFTDFEDAIQYYAALRQNVDFLVTRNKKDYLPNQIPVLTPHEFLAVLHLS